MWIIWKNEMKEFIGQFKKDIWNADVIGSGLIALIIMGSGIILAYLLG